MNEVSRVKLTMGFSVPDPERINDGFSRRSGRLMGSSQSFAKCLSCGR